MFLNQALRGHISHCDNHRHYVTEILKECLRCKSALIEHKLCHDDVGAFFSTANQDYFRIIAWSPVRTK